MAAESNVIPHPSDFIRGNHTKPVPASLFRGNRDRLIENLRKSTGVPENAFVVLQGGDEVPFNDTDINYEFRQESFFQWCFGVEEPGCYGGLDITSGKSILFFPRLPAEYEIWSGKLSTLDEFKERYDVDETYYVDEIARVLEKKNAQLLLTLRGHNSDSGLVTKEIEFDGLVDFPVDNAILYPVICECRVIKSPAEIDVLRYVCKISSDAHKVIMRNVRPGMSEFQAESLFKHYCYAVGGCRHVSYTCICGSGHNSSILHYGHAGAPNNRVLKDGVRHSYCPLPQEKERLALPANSDEPIDVIESLKTCTISETDNVTSDHEDTTMTGECTLTNDPSEAPATPIKSNTSTRPLSQHIVTNNLETHTTPRKSSFSNLTVPEEVVIVHPETYRTPKKAETSIRRLSVYNNLLTPIRKLEIVVEACEPPDHHPQSQGTPKKPETPGRRMSIQNSGGLGTPRASDASERRLSQVQPFSFEQREKENQEMRELRREYYKNLADKMNNQSFKAKPAPKFTQSRGNPAVESPQRKVIRVPKKTGSKIAEKSDKSKISASLPKKTQPLKASNILKPANIPRQPAAPKPVNAPKPANIPPALTAKAKSTSSLAQTQKPTASFAVSKIFKQNSATVTGNFPKFNTQKKPKLFQPVVPHRKLELPKVPELLTAKRARERQQFEERLREREREKEEARKKEEAIQKAKEQEEIANMRKATVFKARPVPQYRNVLPQVPKRPLTEPMFPIWTKRRRCL